MEPLKAYQSSKIARYESSLLTYARKPITAQRLARELTAMGSSTNRPVSPEELAAYDLIMAGVEPLRKMTAWIESGGVDEAIQRSLLPWQSWAMGAKFGNGCHGGAEAQDPFRDRGTAFRARYQRAILPVATRVVGRYQPAVTHPNVVLESWAIFATPLVVLP